MTARILGRLTGWQVITLFVVIGIGVCVLNYTDAQKSNEESNVNTSLADAIPDYTGLFDKGETPRNYLSNGDFYSQGKPRRLGIDTSFIDKVDTAIWWYDKVISEFPGTEEANIALISKIRTLIGWEDGYGDGKKYYGLHAYHDHGKIDGYFSLIATTFLELETGFPDDEYLEAFAFQIAQRYFYYLLVFDYLHYKNDCKQWLEKTIELAKGKDTFYSHLAKLRLPLIQ